MTAPLILTCLWFISANVIAMLPTRDHHWRAAYILIGVGIPLLGWLTWEQGPILGLLVLAAGASILRWPVIFLWRRMRRLLGWGPSHHG
ncbi:DUF2484 family protein [Neogemmobacter tilapiae]|uniref:DUF2484 family protein n=1 Tax=Neogemmobacter tilapiae TaxID=875041 RepID=A0A918TPA2_9RHOB|nr:DUF2484 family protein [Gemmobacter tilapiae]GHC57259.1 hypothetical protein GCM10007315_20820 [Gemmobacter tilapiae]